jgi:energy-coupling factor transporter ATP-binding protein EcfA2
MTIAEPLEAFRQAFAQRVVGFLGPALSVAAGYPTPRELVNEVMRRGDFPADVIQDIGDIGDTASIDECVETLVSATTREYVVELEIDVLRAMSVVLPTPSNHLLDALANLPFTHCLTLATDDVAAKTFAKRSPIVLRGLPGELNLESSRLFQPGSFALVQLMGSIDRPESVRLTTSEIGTLMRADPSFSKTIGSLISSASVVFAGLTVRDIENILTQMPDLLDAMRGGTHFALVADDARTASRSSARRLLSLYGLHLIAYAEDGTFSELTAILESAKANMPEPTVAVAESLAAGAPVPAGPRLRAVRLTDIGPFASLALDFVPKWNVVLGDNGVGKSTILRAIALALRGPEGVTDPNVMRRMLRSGTQKGSIELDVDNDTHRVDLFRQSDGSVYARVAQYSVVQQGAWLTTAFPALRGLSSHRTKGLTAAGRTRPAIEDLDPLITEATDTRLDDLQQWLVNVWFQQSSQSALLKAFFDVLADLLPKAKITFGDVDATTYEVLVDTPDGRIPLDQLSQGLSSLLAWVGYTLQRLFEIHADAPDAMQRSALVLVDEIDAHLHPEWQRMLVPIIAKHFPNVQIVATTHSPLIVGSLGPESVYVCSRGDDGGVIVTRPELDFAGLRADQILTSPAFGLDTTRDVQTAKLLDEYRSLAVRVNRSPEDDRRLEELSAALDTSVSSGETDTERDAEREEHRQAHDPASMINRFSNGLLTDAERAAIVRNFSALGAGGETR